MSLSETLSPLVFKDLVTSHRIMYALIVEMNIHRVFAQDFDSIATETAVIFVLTLFWMY